MGNNLLNACKNVNNGDNNNENGEQNQQLMKETEKRKQERRIKTNRFAPASVHSTLDGQGGQSQQGKISNYPNSIDGSSQQGIDGFKGNSIINQNGRSSLVEGSVEGNQLMKQNYINSMNSSQEGSPTKIGDSYTGPLNKTRTLKKSQDQDELLESIERLPNGGITTAGNGLSDIPRQEQRPSDQGEEEAMLKNNNDMYFSKEDLTYYEQIRHNAEKKTIVHRDKNIRWQPGEVLGSGSFGQVILGMNIDTGEFMAVKQISIGGYNQADRKEKVQQIQSEIETLQNFSDKHIVRYIGIKKSENSINIFLEYVPGGSISSLLYRYNKFNETLIRKFTTQILKGLEYLHSNEIIHRDIKGANVLVDKDGNCKLADFGSAKKIVEEKGHNDSIRGTPYWMAPETIKQVGSGRFADIWSIGCTVIEMATAKPPWADKTPIQAMFYIANASEAPPIPEHLSAECKDFVSKCLRIRPRERYNVRQLLNHRFISGVKNMTMNQPSKYLTRITEEPTLEGQTTSSPGFRKDFPNRMESRGNTQFHEDNSMIDTKILSIKSKTFQSNNIHKNSDSDKSIDSIDHPKHSLRQISKSHSRKIATKHLTSGSVEREDSKDKSQQNLDSQGQSSKNIRSKSRNNNKNNNSSFSSNSSSSSNSSNSSDENKKIRQITSKSLKTNKSQTSNKHLSQAGSQQWSSEGQNENESIYGGIHEVTQTNIKTTQPLLSLFSGRQSFGKHHTVNNLSTDNNDYDDNDIDNNSTNNKTGRNQQNQTNTSINFKDNTTFKRQEKEGSVSTFKTTNFKQQGNRIRIQQNIYQDSRDNEEEDEISHVRLVSRGSEGKITKKVGDIRDLDSSPGGREGGNDGSEEEFIQLKSIEQQGKGSKDNNNNKNSQKLVQVESDDDEEEEKKETTEDNLNKKMKDLKINQQVKGKNDGKQQVQLLNQNGNINEEQKEQQSNKKDHRQLLSQQQQQQNQQLGAMDHSQHHIRAQSLSQTSCEEFEFDQGAVDQIIKHQTSLADQNNQPIRRIKTTRQKFLKQSSQQSQQQQQQISQQTEDRNDDINSSAYGKGESFAGTEKFGRFRHNGPISPKLLTQISNGPSINGCSLDHILLQSTKQGCVPTSESFLPSKTLNTQHNNNNQFTQYFNQEHATSNSINGIWQDQQQQLHHQLMSGNSISSNNNYRQQQQSSIDQHMLAQFMEAKKEKQ